MASRTRALIILTVILVALAVFLLKVKNEMADFEVNYRAGHRLDLGETLYRPSDLHWQFKYSPFSALVYWPLSFLPLDVAKGIWFFLVAGSIAAIVGLARALALSNAATKNGIAAAACLILAKYFLRELQLGQINALITAVLMGMIALIVRDERTPSPSHQAAAGILWGLASALKPYAVIFLPYFILRKKTRALATGCGVLAVSLVVPALFYGWRGNLDVIREWAVSLSKSTPVLYASQDNVSIMGFLAKWTNNPGLSYVLFGAAAAVLALATLAVVLGPRLKPEGSVLDGALLLVLIPLLSPLGWDYTFLSSYLAVVVILRSLARFPKAGRICLAANFAVIGLALYDLLGRQAYAAFMSWSVPTVNFLLIATALFFLRFTKAA